MSCVRKACSVVSAGGPGAKIGQGAGRILGDAPFTVSEQHADPKSGGGVAGAGRFFEQGDPARFVRGHPVAAEQHLAELGLGLGISLGGGLLQFLEVRPAVAPGSARA